MTWRIDHVQLAMPAGAEEAARAFYGDLLGFAEEPKPAPLAARGGAWFRAGPVEIHLGVEPGFQPARKAHPGLQPPDLDDPAARLVAADVAVTWDEALGDRRRFYAADPFGNRLEFLGERQGLES